MVILDVLLYGTLCTCIVCILGNVIPTTNRRFNLEQEVTVLTKALQCILEQEVTVLTKALQCILEVLLSDTRS